MQNVFISYAREDHGFAHRLRQELGKIGWPSWRDLDELRAGDKWRQQLNAGLKASGILIVILTPAATRSRWVRTEYKTALANGATVIPVIAKDVSVPRVLREFQCIDARRTRQPWLRILHGLITARRRGPQITAKFDLDDYGDPYEAEGDEYLFEIGIENPPRGARRVKYEFHDPTRSPSIFYSNSPQIGFTLFEHQSYGDFAITATIDTPRGTVVVRSTLWTALYRQHSPAARRSITTALNQIRRN